MRAAGNTQFEMSNEHEVSSKNEIQVAILSTESLPPHMGPNIFYGLDGWRDRPRGCGAQKNARCPERRVHAAPTSRPKMWCPKKSMWCPKKEHVVPEKKACGARKKWPVSGLWCPKKKGENPLQLLEFRRVVPEKTHLCTGIWCPKKLAPRFGSRFGSRFGRRLRRLGRRLGRRVGLPFRAPRRPVVWANHKHCYQRVCQPARKYSNKHSNMLCFNLKLRSSENKMSTCIKAQGCWRLHAKGPGVLTICDDFAFTLGARPEPFFFGNSGVRFGFHLGSPRLCA